MSNRLGRTLGLLRTSAVAMFRQVVTVRFGTLQNLCVDVSCNQRNERPGLRSRRYKFLPTGRLFPEVPLTSFKDTFGHSTVPCPARGQFHDECFLACTLLAATHGAVFWLDRLDASAHLSGRTFFDYRCAEVLMHLAAGSITMWQRGSTGCMLPARRFRSRQFNPGGLANTA